MASKIAPPNPSKKFLYFCTVIFLSLALFFLLKQGEFNDPESAQAAILVPLLFAAQSFLDTFKFFRNNMKLRFAFLLIQLALITWAYRHSF